MIVASMSRYKEREMKNPIRMVLLGTVVSAAMATLPWALWADTSPASGPPEIRLPQPATTGGMSLTEALANRRSVRTFADKPLSTQDVAQLCWAAQGITKVERGLRVAPSAHGLYPIGVFIVDKNGLYQYQPKTHALHRLADGDMLQKLRAATNQAPIAAAPLCMILTMDVQSLVPKCGDKAERYCLLEAGHVAENVLLQATALGLVSVPVGGIDEAPVAKAMNLPTGLRPVYVLPVGYPKAN